MSSPITRRCALTQLGAAGAGLILGRSVIRGQGRPIVVGGREVEISVTSLGPSTVKLRPGFSARIPRRRESMVHNATTFLGMLALTVMS